MSLHQYWHRSQSNRIFAGVCGGLSETWGTDANLIRLFWVLFTIWTHAAGFILYLVAVLVLPAGDRGESAGNGVEVIQESEEIKESQQGEKKLSNRRTQQWIGMMLMLAGGYWLVERFAPNVIDEVRKVALPLILIALGLWLVLKEKRGEGE